MTPTIAIIAALDTKGEDFAFLKTEIERRGCKTIVIDFSIVGQPAFSADVPREEVAQASGTPFEQLLDKRDRGEAMIAMASGVAEIVRRLYAEDAIQGIISMGGSGATSVATTAMRALPIGFPKVMVSTLASGDVSGFVGTSDILMLHSVIDVTGVNRISRMIYGNAAGAICGMVLGETPKGADKPLIAASMFGNTTRAVNHAKAILEAAGYEVLVFHATGTGGRTMETLIENGLVVGVLDMTTTEWADELLGGVLSAGPDRLDAAAQNGIPQIVVPGCLDMCNFWGRETIVERYRDRTFYEWNASVTLMRTTPAETAQLGEIFARKLNTATGPVAVYIPTRGWSEIDIEGQPFHSPEAIQAFTDTLKANLRSDIPVVELDTHINDPAFAEAAANALLALEGVKS
ncbi:MAG: Tm-1-like ATP-binding domain-containing protein [bacterium]|nr:Tm-1-like ATP-binding domain-containing protein [bacterium]